MEQIEKFKELLQEEGIAKTTIKVYLEKVKLYIDWFESSYGCDFKRLYRGNIQDYKSYLLNNKRIGKDNHHLDGKTVNNHLSALAKYNALIQPEDIVISRKDYVKIQSSGLNPTDITKEDVEAFRQRILQDEGCHHIRNYTFVTMLAYCGLRISEALALKRIDVHIDSRQLRVRDGKGGKQRTVIMCSKVCDAINEYMKEYNNPDTEYLFYNAKGEQLARSTFNVIFKQFSTKDKPIHPHLLRHFFCYNCIANGYTVNEIAQQAGHSDIKTSMQYLNPTLKDIMKKSDRL